MALTKCEACGDGVSAEAKTCIHCGHPLKTHSHRLLWIGLALCIAGAVTVYFGRGFAYGLIDGFVWASEGHPGLPSCDSSAAQTNARRAFEGSPFAKISGLSIAAFSNPRTISVSESRMGCKATVILNNSEMGFMDYSFTHDPSLPLGEFIIREALEENSLKPTP